MLFAIELTELDTEFEERELLATDDGSDEDTTTDDKLDEEGAIDEGTDEESAIDEGATDEGAVEERTEDRLDDKADELGALLDCGVELLPPTMPQGEGCAAQVERDIQLLLFS